MRVNKFIALATGMSRRAADAVIEQGRVQINDQKPPLGYTIVDGDTVTLDGTAITPAVKTTIMLHKPVGYVCSRNGQGSKTIYDLLPQKYHHLKPVGRLDKDSSGLLLLTNDGGRANELTHPSRHKTKIYEITLNKPLEPLHQQIISDHGVILDDGPSRFEIIRIGNSPTTFEVQMSEGRNRQIRRTFASLGYTVIKLHRTHFGPYSLGTLSPGQTKEV